MSEITIRDLQEKWDNGDYKNQIPYPTMKKFRENHVFDEDKSVKWNREEVERQNALRNEEFKKYREGESEAHRKLTKDSIQAIMNEYPSFHRPQAERIQSYAYTEHHSHISDYFIHLDEYAEFVSEVIEAVKE